MARLSRVSLRLAFVVVAVVLISVRESDSRLKTTGSFGIARAFAATAPTPDPKNDVAVTSRLSSSYGKLPISFEANHGQTDARVRFLARGAGYNVFLTSSEVVLALHRSHGDDMQSHRLPSSMLHGTAAGISEAAVETATVRMQLIGSDPSNRVEGMDALPGKANYLIGNDPRKWHVDVPTYAKVRFAQIYRGIDLVYYGNQEGRVEHDFVVAPGADPKQIKFELRAEDQTAVLNDGELALHTKAGDLRLCAPVAYQEIGGTRKRVQASYEADESANIHFNGGPYDSHLPLIIDPVLVYSAVFGGGGNDLLASMTVDPAGNVYLIGQTSSVDFPLVNPYQSAPAQAFVSKLNSGGTALLYSSYLDAGLPHGIAVDGNGRAYFAADASVFGAPALIAALNPSGNALVWSTNLGDSESARAITLDSHGSLYVTGITGSSSPVFIRKFNNAGVLQYAYTYNLGAASGAISSAIAADSNGSAYITGYSFVHAVPTTPGAFRSSCNQYACAFVAKLTPGGDSLEYSTVLGDFPGYTHGIAVDSDGNAYVGGEAYAPGLPVWSSGFQRTYGGGQVSSFVVKVNTTGSNLVWSTYLGGTGVDSYDRLTGLAIDKYRQVYVSGFSCSHNFPLKAPIQTKTPTGCQLFVTTLSPSLSSIQYYSTFLGGPAVYRTFFLQGIAVDAALNVYVAGPDDNNVQPTPGAYSIGSSSMAAGFAKVFVSKLTIMDDLAVALSASPTPVPHGSNLTYTIGVTSKGPDFGVNVRLSDTLPAGTTFVSYDAGGGTCTAPPVGSAGTLNCTLAQLNSGTTWYVKLTVNVGANSGTTLSNMAATISNMQDFVTSNNSATITTHVN
jgi:uncharacterized repeat protein (TIGR01451 family)